MCVHDWLMISLTVRSVMIVIECDVHGLTGCTVRIVAFDEFLILVNLVCINCSKLLHVDSPSVYCIIMSMRMVADVETLKVFDQKDYIDVRIRVFVHCVTVLATLMHG